MEEVELVRILLRLWSGVCMTIRRNCIFKFSFYNE